MISKVYSAIPDGYTGHIIEVEGNTSRNLPSFNIVGMASKTISEARERVRSAITSSGFIFPSLKVTINLAPAELVKSGSHLDLPIALSVLILSQTLLPESLDGRLFVGELSLDGTIRPVRGIINIVEAAKKAGFKEVFLPQGNLSTAHLIRGVKLTPVRDLLSLVLHLKGISPIAPPPPLPVVPPPTSTPPPAPTLDDIRGQDFAKRALIVALAGHHNILLSGPPGAGKTMLARAALSLLPPLSLNEQIEVTKLHSLTHPSHPVCYSRPFRTPHHSASSAAILGGGHLALPGEISLAHRGILFLDELPEFDHRVLESLRQPLEDKTITVTRLNHSVTYPADFMLIATMNPCPCGYLSDPSHPCSCTAKDIHNYHRKLSGPILDRIDIIVNVEKTNLTTITQSISSTACEKPSRTRSEHQDAITLISTARARQKARYGPRTRFNYSLTSKELASEPISPDALALLDQAAASLNLSTRGYFKTLRVARTIADSCSSPEIQAQHLAEALSFRGHLG